MEHKNGALQEALLAGEHESLGDEKWVWREVKQQLAIAGPMVFVAVLQYLLIVVSVMFVGHTGELEFAGASVAASCAGVTGTTLIYGLAAALETLCGQAYGAQQYHMLGIYTQRAIFVLNLVAVPVAVIWWNIESVLLFLGQDPAISNFAGVYAKSLVPTIFAVATLQPLVKFLQTQSVVLPMVMFSVATLLLHVPLCYLLVFKFGFGFRGAALASSLSNWLNVVWHASYVRFSSNCKKTWTSTFSTEAFNDLSGFFRLAIPSAVMICLEYWAFEVLVLISGLLPNPELETSTLSVCLTSASLLYMIPFGIGAAASTRVGNELGAGRAQAARGAVAVAVCIGVTEGLVTATTLYLLREKWGKAFTHEQEIVEYVALCLPFVVITHLLDSIQGVLSGVARGCGWQAFGAAANLGAFYLVGLPAAVTLAFKFDLKGRGLWLGSIMGTITQSVTLVVLTCATNWQQQADQALTRVHCDASATLPIKVKHPPLLACKDGDLHD